MCLSLCFYHSLSICCYFMSILLSHAFLSLFLCFSPFKTSFWLPLNYSLYIPLSFFICVSLYIIYLLPCLPYSSFPLSSSSPPLAHLSIDNIEKRFPFSFLYSEQLAIYWLWLAAPTQGVPHLRQEGGMGDGDGGGEGGAGCWGSVWTNWWAAWQFVNIRREQTNASVFPRPRPLCLLSTFGSLFSYSPYLSLPLSPTLSRLHIIFGIFHMCLVLYAFLVFLWLLAQIVRTHPCPRLRCIFHLSYALSISLSLSGKCLSCNIFDV